MGDVILVDIDNQNIKVIIYNKKGKKIIRKLVTINDEYNCIINELTDYKECKWFININPKLELESLKSINEFMLNNKILDVSYYNYTILELEALYSSKKLQTNGELSLYLNLDNDYKCEIIFDNKIISNKDNMFGYYKYKIQDYFNSNMLVEDFKWIKKYIIDYKNYLDTILLDDSSINDVFAAYLKNDLVASKLVSKYTTYLIKIIQMFACTIGHKNFYFSIGNFNYHNNLLECLNKEYKIKYPNDTMYINYCIIEDSLLGLVI